MRVALTLTAAWVLCTTGAAIAQEPVPTDLLIRLERTACYGECPVYSVAIDGEGKVTYVGTRFVRAMGEHVDRIPVLRVAALLATARGIGFFSLNERYTAPITDLPTTIVTITAGGVTKRIEDYARAPRELKQLEQDIDDAANTRRWIRIDEPTLTLLMSDGHLGSNEERADLLQKAVSSDDVDVVRALLEIGVDPNSMYYTTGTTPLMFVRSAAAAQALIAAGAQVAATNANGNSPLGAAACAGNAAVVKVLLSAGAPPDSPGWAGQPALTCARQRRDSMRSGPPPPDLGTKRLYVIDYDGVVEALERALAK